MMNRKQIRDYLLNVCDVKDSKRINDTTLNIDINLAQSKVQTDLLDLGIKQFTKIAYRDGFIAALPTDLLFHNNAIIDIEATAGSKATLDLQFANALIITIKAIDPGTVMNNWIIRFSHGNYSTPQLLLLDAVNKTVIIGFRNDNTTVQAVEDLFTTDMMLKSMFTLSSNLSKSTTIKLLLEPTDGKLQYGQGTGWKPAEEVSIDGFNRMKNDGLGAGSITEPFYRRLGEKQSIEFYPNQIKHSKIYYNYSIPELTTDLDVSALPKELESVFLLDCQRRVYVYLKLQAQEQAQQLEYAKTIKAFEDKYTKALVAATSDKIKNESQSVTS